MSPDIVSPSATSHYPKNESCAGELERIATAMLTPKRRERAASGVHWDSRHTVDSRLGPVAHWTAGSGPAVLLVHGWEGTHADLDGFVEPLLARGARVAALDLPAHGESSGTTALLTDCAEAIVALGAAIGPLAGAIAHSAGCPSLALALKAGLRARRLV